MKNGIRFVLCKCHSDSVSTVVKNRSVFYGWAMEPGIIEVDMFSSDVDAEEHPEAVAFKEILLGVAEEYGCELRHFEVHRGTVSFSFNSESLTADILKILQGKDPVADN